MIRRIAEAGKGFVSIDHCRKDGTQTVRAVQAFNEPSLSLFQGGPANRVRHHGFKKTPHLVEGQEGTIQWGTNRKVMLLFFRRGHKQFANMDMMGILGLWL